ncbi:sugar transferase [Nocardioides agariphilus]|uniref:Sugar transferase n=1 Tax=Nocardioides agariphilus TaxID=433664 RepID=A0A930YJ04_9ACTN|nr:sugar transferase [Nocardioides agariphilus]MBF4768747.1 sugar transferase [Nocardioides agariphilus]
MTAHAAPAPTSSGTRAYEVAKRALDLTLALTALVLAAPVLLVVATAVRLTSPGPALFRQTRVGRDGVPFTMVKFRTMRDGNDDGAHRDYVSRLLAGEAVAHDGLYKLAGDPRVTPLGRVLRRLSLDELPQLLNVVAGSMSLVGPRPALPFEAELFPGWASVRYAVPPGLTGLWQVSGRNRLTMLEGLRLDVEYVDRRGLRTDLAILLRTVPAVLGRGAR